MKGFAAAKSGAVFMVSGREPDGTVTGLPKWIDDRLDRDLDKTLTQRHVAETMVSADRPFFSTRQLQSRVKPDVSTATVRNRLDELQELDVVATETYPDSVTLYYIDSPESEWPLSPEGQRALRNATPLDRLYLGFLSSSEAVGASPLLLAGLVSCLVVALLGGTGGLVGMGLLVPVDGFVVVLANLLTLGGVSVAALAVQVGVFFMVLLAVDRRTG